jgi:hypothetical protein
MPIKYAYILIDPPFPIRALETPFDLDASTRLRYGSIRDSLNSDQVRHWSEWLGSQTWESMEGEKLILSSYVETRNPEVLDAENQSLQQKLMTIYLALPLAGPLRPANPEAFLISGKGRMQGEEIVAEDVRSHTQLDCWIPSLSYTVFSEEYINWAERSIKMPGFLQVWKDAYLYREKYFQKPEQYRQFIESCRSFDEAMSNRQLEFKIPNLVRAIESLVECRGADDFSERVIHLIGLPGVSCPYEVNENTKALLMDLYKIRNCCVHGKPFEWYFQENGIEAENSLVCRYEFLAEWAARNVLTGGFSNDSLVQVVHDRAMLEKAWNENKIQPHRQRVSL